MNRFTIKEIQVYVVFAYLVGVIVGIICGWFLFVSIPSLFEVLP